MTVAEMTSQATMSKPVVTLMDDDVVPYSPISPQSLDDDLVSRESSTDNAQDRAATRPVPRKLKLYQATVEDVSTPLLSASAFPKPAASESQSAHPLVAEQSSPEATPSPRGRGRQAPADGPRSSSPTPVSSAAPRRPGPDMDMDVEPAVAKSSRPRSRSSRSRDGPRVHFSHRSSTKTADGTVAASATKAQHNPSRQNSSRPRVSQEAALSPVDIKWGRLFDDKGEPTKRLDQLLLGIANYMIKHDEPEYSQVIRPATLWKFYTQFPVEPELIPFDQLLDCYNPDEYSDLKYVYHALGCEFNLVMSQIGVDPDIPCLTPFGFVTWMTWLIKASPDQEAYRLNSIVERLPIQCRDASGDVERLPKQLSRHLLPEKADGPALSAVHAAYHLAYKRSYKRWEMKEKSSLTSSSISSSHPAVYVNDTKRRTRRDGSTTRSSREKRTREPDSPERSKRDRSRREQSRRRKPEQGDNDGTTTSRRHYPSPGRSPERSARRRRTDSPPSRHHRTFSPFSTSSRRYSPSRNDAPRQSSPSKWAVPFFSGRSSVGSDERRRSRDLSPEDTRQSRRGSEYPSPSSRYPAEYRRGSVETSPRTVYDEEDVRRSERRRQGSVSVFR